MSDPPFSGVRAWLTRAPYLSLATDRLDGREVRTPVWFACLGNELVLFSAGEAGKVKRVRRTGRARVARCDVRGSLVDDEATAWLTVRAALVDDPAAIAAAQRALRRKYGWQLWLLDIGARLGGRIGQRQYLRLWFE